MYSLPQSYNQTSKCKRCISSNAYDKEYAMRNYLFKVLPLIANLGDSKDAIKGKTLNSKSLANLLIPLPPLQEQQRIIERINLLSKQLR